MDGKPPTSEELVELTRLQACQIEQLRVEVEQSKRAGKRRAASFSRGTLKADPKRPGRKLGHPPGRRPVPPPEQVDRTIDLLPKS